MIKPWIPALAALVLAFWACNLPASVPPTETPLRMTETPFQIKIAPTDLPTLTTTPIPPTSTPTPTPTPTASPTPLRGMFRLSVLVDTDSQTVSREQAQALVEEASTILARLTGFGFEMVDFQETSGTIDAILAKYFASPGYTTSDGIIIFSHGDNGEAKLYGGYGFARRGPKGFISRFQSPFVDKNSVYIGVVHFGHRYAACGYGGNEEPVSTVSIGGECRGEVGTACVEKHGYQMCSNAVNELYASTPTYFSSATFVHEMMHSFGENENMDHYFTPECTATMQRLASRRPYKSQTYDMAEADFYVNMCPYVFDVFMDSYRP
ncbi:MAG: hypothetical protein DDG60_07960 [Anaerolineae bacterium]|nr:MAG: hypothetical protein DDG60_07960 [Anaerolineae bacterium]